MKRRRRPSQYVTFLPSTTTATITPGVVYNTTSSAAVKVSVSPWRRRLGRMLRAVARRVEGWPA